MECATDDDCLAVNSICVANTSWALELVKSDAVHTVEWAGTTGCSCSSANGIVYNAQESSCSSSVLLIKVYAALAVILTGVTGTLLFLVAYDLMRLIRLGTHIAGLSITVIILTLVSLISVALELNIFLFPLEYDVSMDAFLANERPRASMHKLLNVHFASLFFLSACYIVCVAEMCLVFSEAAYRSSSYGSASRKASKWWHTLSKTVRSGQVVLSILTPLAVFTMSARGGLVPYRVADLVLLCFILTTGGFAVIVFVVYHVGMREVTSKAAKALEYNKRRGMQQEKRARVIKTMSASRGDRNFIFSGIGIVIFVIALMSFFNNKQPRKADGNTVSPSSSIYAYAPTFIIVLRVGLFLGLMGIFRYTRRINSETISAHTNIHVRKPKDHIVRKSNRSQEQNKVSTDKTTSNLNRSSVANCTSGATTGVVGVDIMSDSQRWEAAFSSIVDSLGE